LALGAVAEGCINGLYPNLSQVIIFEVLKQMTWVSNIMDAAMTLCFLGN
jgi:hypothetical protein